MAATYTSVDKVANLLGFPAGYFDTNSTPKDTEIERFIERAEDRIDNRTGHTWRSRTITKEYVRPSSIYRFGTGIRFDLVHRSITTLQSGTDKIEVWDGSAWVDWVATKTEGRDKDYWVDESNGIIYLNGLLRIYPHGVRVTYRFGESTVTGGIEECATMMTASQILNSPEFSAVLFTQAGETRPQYAEKIKWWDEQVEKILSNNQEFQ